VVGRQQLISRGWSPQTLAARGALRSFSTFAPPALAPFQRLDRPGRQALQGRLSLPNLRQIVELDGWDGHSTRTAFREDRARDRRLVVAGYSVAHITWNQLDDEPVEVASDLRRWLLRDR
jgi:hypothetical protein